MRYRLSDAAALDASNILAETMHRFGPHQRRRYAQLIESAAAIVAEDPDRPASRSRDDIGPGVRSFHVELAVRRRGAAAHVLFYRRTRLLSGDSEVLILRILHERMDPSRHMIRNE